MINSEKCRSLSREISRFHLHRISARRGRLILVLGTVLLATAGTALAAPVSGVEPVVQSWSLPNTHGPLCANEGFACRTNGDCCQGVCKDFLVCDAGPVVCVPPHFGCNVDHDCCNGVCGITTHECAAY